jgi:ABC-2 type transport system permease protein
MEIGFIDRLVAAPISRWSFVLGRLGATGVLGLVSGTWFLGVGLIFGAHIAAGPGGALVVLALVALNAMAFGMVGAALALNSGSASVAQGIFPLVFVILFLSSAFFPEGLLKEPAQTIAQWNPMSLIADGLRDPIISNYTFSETLKGLGGIAIIGTIGTLLCALGLRRRVRAG